MFGTEALLKAVKSKEPDPEVCSPLPLASLALLSHFSLPQCAWAHGIYSLPRFAEDQNFQFLCVLTAISGVFTTSVSSLPTSSDMPTTDQF